MTFSRRHVQRYQSWAFTAQALKSVAAWNFVMAHEEFPVADAYCIKRTVLMADNPLQLHASAGPTRLTSAPMSRVVAFHPGALRFYKEKHVL